MQHIPVDAGLVVFLRLPDKGKVKTRLAATLGEEAALEIYKKLVSITLDIVIRSEIPTYLFYTNGLPPASTRDARFSYHIQVNRFTWVSVLHTFFVPLLPASSKGTMVTRTVAVSATQSPLAGTMYLKS